MLNNKRRNIWQKYALLFLLLSGFISAIIPKHAIYIGVVQITHEEKEALTTIQIKVFSDDLQSVLQNDLGYDKVPSITALCETTITPIEFYFKKQLEIKVDQEFLDFQLVKCQQINDVHLLTFQSDQEAEWQHCSINAPFFMELFPLQSNIINFKYIPTNAAAMHKMDRVVKGNSIVEISL